MTMLCCDHRQFGTRARAHGAVPQERCMPWRMHAPCPDEQREKPTLRVACQKNECQLVGACGAGLLRAAVGSTGATPEEGSGVTGRRIRRRVTAQSARSHTVLIARTGSAVDLVHGCSKVTTARARLVVRVVCICQRAAIPELASASATAKVGAPSTRSLSSPSSLYSLPPAYMIASVGTPSAMLWHSRSTSPSGAPASSMVNGLDLARRA